MLNKSCVSLIFILLVIKQLLSVPLKSGINNQQPGLIVVSYDGFRNEYFNRNVTNYMNKLRFTDGTYTDFMKNIFPTKTFPNHHSISTGVFANVHGVMANSFYDQKLGPLGYGYELFHFNEELTPIWVSTKFELSKTQTY